MKSLQQNADFIKEFNIIVSTLEITDFKVYIDNAVFDKSNY